MHSTTAHNVHMAHTVHMPTHRTAELAAWGGRADEPSTPLVTTDADGYTVPQLRDHPGLVCCVVGCATNVHRLWFYHADTRVDRRRVCGHCIGKWPDLRSNFGEPYAAYGCSRQPAHSAAATA